MLGTTFEEEGSSAQEAEEKASKAVPAPLVVMVSDDSSLRDIGDKTTRLGCRGILV